MIQVLNSQCSLDWFKAKSRGNHCFSMFFSWNLGLSCNFSRKSMTWGARSPQDARLWNSILSNYSMYIGVKIIKHPCVCIYIYDYMCILYIYIYCSIPKFQVFVFPCLELSLPATGFATFFFVPTTAPLQAAKSFKIGRPSGPHWYKVGPPDCYVCWFINHIMYVYI